MMKRKTPPMTPGSMKVQLNPKALKRMATTGRRSIVPKLWMACMPPIAAPRLVLNQVVTLETSGTWNTVMAMPRRNPKYR